MPCVFLLPIRQFKQCHRAIGCQSSDVNPGFQPKSNLYKCEVKIHFTWKKDYREPSVEVSTEWGGHSLWRGQYVSREMACARTDAKMLGQSGELSHLAACCMQWSAGRDSAEGVGKS